MEVKVQHGNLYFTIYDITRLNFIDGKVASKTIKFCVTNHRAILNIDLCDGIILQNCKNPILKNSTFRIIGVKRPYQSDGKPF